MTLRLFGGVSRPMLDFDQEVIDAGQHVANFLGAYSGLLQFLGGDELVMQMKQEVIFNMQNKSGMTIADALSEHYKFIAQQYGLPRQHII